MTVRRGLPIFYPAVRISCGALLSLSLLLVSARDASAAGCKGGSGRTDIPVTTTIVDLDAAGNLYTISSDGKGSYLNGVDNVTSILTANTYNCQPPGDWQFNKPFTVKGKTVTSNRKVGVSLNTSDAIVEGDPHFLVPANPAFWGTQILTAQSEVKCSLVFVSMGQMAPGTARTCPLLFAFTTADGIQYGLHPAYSFTGYPETTDVQVSCNSADSAGCNDWFIEPIGSLKAVGRHTHSGAGDNLGDFYMRFKIHVTRP